MERGEAPGKPHPHTAKRGTQLNWEKGAKPMSHLHRPVDAGQVVSLVKSPQYWLRRAEQHRKRGEHYRAAALLRHAVALDPASGDLRMEYAKALRDMSCFEASTREAFGALALEPTGFAPYQIIGRNMLSMGREQEAIDAFSHYLEQARELPGLLFSDDDDELFELEDLLDAPPRRGKARLDALIHIGSLRLARGDLAGAQRVLARAQQRSELDDCMHALGAMLCQAMEQPERALAHARLSASQNPQNVPALCALASVRLQMRQRELASAALMKAALCCRYPHDEQLLCFTSCALGMPELALAMLRLSRHKNPVRLPTLHNYAVALLKQGQLSDALAYLHRCRDLDPQDLTVQSVFETAMSWSEQALPKGEVSKNAEEISFYPFLSPEAMDRMLLSLGLEFGSGVEGVASRLHTDEAFYRQFLQILSISGDTLARLLYPIASVLEKDSPSTAERLLRDVLVQSAPSEDAKRYALSALVALGVKPPYVIWQSGRILKVAPREETDVPASFLQRRLLRRIRATAARVRDARMIPHVLTLLSRMGYRLRYAFAADRGQRWSIAMVRHFSLVHGMTPPDPVINSPNSDFQRRVDRAFCELCALMPLP